MTDMEIDALRRDYQSKRSDYMALQQEAFDFAEGLRQMNVAIHIAHIQQRPGNAIKSLSAIEENIRRGDKYSACQSILDIKDIAGVRVTCYCEDDLENFSTLLEGELRQKYRNVAREDKGGDANSGKSRAPYRAVHISFSKNGASGEIFCEIQLRTVMADAWAMLDRRYVYGKTTEGDTYDVTAAVSEIMKGCEKLWSVVKRKSPVGPTRADEEFVENLRRETERRIAGTRILKNKELAAWFDYHALHAKEGYKTTKHKTYMEVKVSPPDIGVNVKRKALYDAAQNSTISTFGWPIAIFMTREEYKPRMNDNGIHAEILIQGENAIHNSYDYWALNTNGAIYLLKSLFEDDRKPGAIFFDTRIIRITELLMYIRNLYFRLGIPDDSKISISIGHYGLQGRVLTAASPNRHLFDRKTDLDTVKTETETSVSEIKNDLATVVERFTSELFEAFEFFELAPSVLREIVENFSKGKI